MGKYLVRLKKTGEVKEIIPPTSSGQFSQLDARLEALRKFWPEENLMETEVINKNEVKNGNN